MGTTQEGAAPICEKHGCEKVRKLTHGKPRGWRCRKCQAELRRRWESFGPLQAFCLACDVPLSSPGHYCEAHRDLARRLGHARRSGKFKLSAREFLVLLDHQRGVCAVCGRPETAPCPTGSGYARLCVDHCHKTGKVRGLLCRGCNVGIGNLGDDPELVLAAALYLESHAAA